MSYDSTNDAFLSNVSCDYSVVQTSPERPVECAGRTEGFLHWYVAVVLNNTEKSSAARLSEAGYETFLPTQVYFSIWKDGRRKKRERIVLPHMLFVHCTERQRLEVLQHSFVRRFMTDKAGTPDAQGRHPFVIIPDDQMSRFKFMLEKADDEVCYNEFNIRKGMKVRVIRGSLQGLEGIVTELNSAKTRVYLNMDILGSVSVLIDTASVQYLPQSTKSL